MYLAVGLASALIDFVAFEILYSVFGVDVALANPLAIVISMVFNFSANRNATFKSASSPLRSAFLYALLFAFNTVITTLAIAAMVSAGLHSAIAKVIMQACAAVWNFFIYRFVIFV